MSNNGFCPLIKGECRRDCKWCDPVTVMDDEGFDEELVCQVANIASSIMLGFGFIEPDGWEMDYDD